MDNINEKDEIIMKLLHYFITEKNYNPVVLHGAKDEIWLENMNGDYKIVRLVSNHIHNNEQLKFDIFKTRRIVKNIKKRTLNITMPVLSIFVDLGDNVELTLEKDIDFVHLENTNDIKKYDFIYKHFPDIDKKMEFSEEGVNLFMKVTDDINKKNIKQAQKVEEIFRPKKIIVTYILIIVNILIFLIGIGLNIHNGLLSAFGNNSQFIKEGEYYRLFTSMFLHVDILHIGFNMYALYILGKEAESFFGKTKFLTIYILSGLSGSLLSMLLTSGTSVGASGAIFGIMGALLYFGYNYRVYLGNTLIRQILPVILINLLFGFSVPSIDNYGHIGGLIGGITTSMALGFTNSKDKTDKINGIIITILLFGFLIFMNFFYAGK